MNSAKRLVDHFFRHESGRLVSLLTGALGARNLDLIEDVVQSALTRALQSWSRNGIPDDPAGWLYRVARNAAIDSLRRDQRWEKVRERIWESAEASLPEEPLFEGEFADEQLRMLFLCCHAELPAESQVALALKTLCGFDVREIAPALLTSEANIQKRLTRAKERLRQLDWRPGDPDGEMIRGRLEAVRTVVYLLFNEGYNSSLPDRRIRRELCDEAIRLGRLLAGHPLAGEPATQALLSLMLFHAARFDAREDNGESFLLLEDQDRSRWDRDLLWEGWRRLIASGRGERLSRYHLEAGIAAEHCLVASPGETNWTRVVELYDLLIRLVPSPIHELNRAVAISRLRDPESALRELDKSDPPGIAEKYYLWHAVVGELSRQTGDFDRAKRSLTKAIEQCPSESEKNLLRRRVGLCGE